MALYSMFSFSTSYTCYLLFWYPFCLTPSRIYRSILLAWCYIMTLYFASLSFSKYPSFFTHVGIPHSKCYGKEGKVGVGRESKKFREGRDEKVSSYVKRKFIWAVKMFKGRISKIYYLGEGMTGHYNFVHLYCIFLSFLSNIIFEDVSYT